MYLLFEMVDLLNDEYVGNLILSFAKKIKLSYSVSLLWFDSMIANSEGS